ncbi:hypothetical protein NDU88_004387 [Pleurodeles waltl]|uniref:Uncharacterized protein n=1 Tax=Pleurodeles waltl TaxID=8319 RepID=A0AAV7SIS0_PLEWA|nr:hypothetical protein NDU88_004387 [Pleurodeles waltl]
MELHGGLLIKLEVSGGSRTVGVVAWRGASQNRVEIQEDGTMALICQHVTIESMETADAEEAEVVGTGT